MKSYLCIGGPKHGTVLAVRDDARTVEVASYDRPYVGISELLPDSPVCFRRETYTVKQLGVGEEVQDIAGNGNITARVRVNVTMTALVHESILTTEEAVAYFRKLRESDIYDAILFASRRLKLGGKKG